MDLKELSSISKENGLEIASERLAELGRYADLLREWNAKINLVSRKDEENILSRHVLHSLTLRMPSVCEYEFGGKRVLDIGTGGGLPGIPLRIVTESLEITLVDSIQKKIMVCTDIAQKLELTGVHTRWGRAEEVAKEKGQSGSYDAVVSRAVAPLDDLVRWTQGFLRPSGTLFSLKGGDLTGEIERTRRLSRVTGVHERLLALAGYDDFAKEEKKLVRVDLR